MVMNLYKKITLLSYAACGLLPAADPAYTSPVGYSTQTLKVGYNLIGITLQTSPLAAGKFETITNTTATDNDVTYAPVAGKTYVLEITSGTLIGSIFEVPAASISGGAITITTVPATDLVALGLTTADSYKLRVAPTLENIFTTVPLSSGGVLNAGLSATGADVVWIPTGAGTYNKYFLHSNTAAFRRAGTSTPTPNIPLIYADGILVQKKTATAASLTVSGEVKNVGTNSALVTGYNLLSAVAPVGLTLANAGIENGLTPGLSATGADLLWIQQPDLSYIKYFRRTNGAWRTSTVAVDMTAPEIQAVTLSKGFYIQRKARGTVALKLNVPSNYTNF